MYEANMTSFGMGKHLMLISDITFIMEEAKEGLMMLYCDVHTGRSTARHGYEVRRCWKADEQLFD